MTLPCQWEWEYRSIQNMPYLKNDRSFKLTFKSFFPNLPWRTSILQLTNKQPSNKQAAWIHSFPGTNSVLKQPGGREWVAGKERAGKYSLSYDFSFLPWSCFTSWLGPGCCQRPSPPPEGQPAGCCLALSALRIKAWSKPSLWYLWPVSKISEETTFRNIDA